MGRYWPANELVLTFGGLHVCVQFGKNRRRNATVRVSTDGQTHTHGQTQNDCIICPMLYAIAMGQITRWQDGYATARQINKRWRRQCRPRLCINRCTHDWKRRHSIINTCLQQAITHRIASPYITTSIIPAEPPNVPIHSDARGLADHLPCLSKPCWQADSKLLSEAFNLPGVSE